MLPDLTPRRTPGQQWRRTLSRLQAQRTPQPLPGDIDQHGSHQRRRWQGRPPGHERSQPPHHAQGHQALGEQRQPRGCDSDRYRCSRHARRSS
ncbi:hypothetical protein [Halomonas halophila]|uniref:hypothetical protein n=1 Tax=Halomonas halophila TaxID=29573 RepID=UPI003626FBDA